MKHQLPEILSKSNIANAPLKYKWNSDIHDDFMGGEKVDNNVKLFKVFSKLNYKANIAMAAAAAEWICYRLATHINFGEIFLRVDALWAAAINVDYIKNTPIAIGIFRPSDQVEGVLWCVVDAYETIMSCILRRSVYITEGSVYLSVLAQYIMPKGDKTYQEWLQNKLRILASKFPCPYDIYSFDGHDREAYDSSSEPPIPRDFIFEDEFDYDKNGLTSCNLFLSELKKENNPYLFSSEELIQRGFSGTPYTL